MITAVNKDKRIKSWMISFFALTMMLLSIVPLKANAAGLLIADVGLGYEIRQENAFLFQIQIVAQMGAFVSISPGFSLGHVF